MVKVVIGARSLLGLIFLVFGLNGFLEFFPMPPLKEAMQSYAGALTGTGYFFPLLKATEALMGLCLLSNMFVPLALIVLSPIVIHIALANIFLDTTGLPIAIVVVVTMLVTAKGYWPYFSGVLTRKAEVDPILRTKTGNR